MKLRHKILLSTGLMWLLFLIVTFVLLEHVTPSLFLLSFIVMGAVFFAALHTLTNIFLFKNISSIEENSHSSALTHFDSLTKIPDKNFFSEIFNKTMGHARRHNLLLGILLIDLDHFRNINDEFGSAQAHAILKEISDRFVKVLRVGDYIARLEDDQFVILLNDIKHLKFASPIAEKILQVCAKPINVNGQNIIITTSIGISIFPTNGTTLDTLLENAELALYKAKSVGGGTYHYFTTQMTSEAHAHLKIESSLRNALANSEFILYFQPIFDISKGKIGDIVSIEALLRWSNPEKGIISPNNFIPQTEESNLIMKLGEWALYQACRTNKFWQDQGYKSVTISVNLSPKQLTHENIVPLIENVLAETKLEPQYLALEITESSIMEDIEAITIILEKIKKLGVKICIDDFGTGYTSISHLKNFPIDVLKIDQSFIRNLTTNQNDLAITTAIISLAHNLGMQVVAEGVETIEQLNCLMKLKCDLIQGFYFSRPVTESKIVSQLTSF